MESLEGRVALITGASRGIGAATARMLDAAGVKLGLVSRSGDDLDIGDAIGVAADVRDPEAVRTAVEAVVERHGGLDILFVNAGVGAYGPILELALWLDHVMARYARAVYTRPMQVAIDATWAAVAFWLAYVVRFDGAVPSPERRQYVFAVAIVVTVVSAMIHVYSIGYMHHDHSIPRFMAYLNLFVFFMLMLVLANNYTLLFVGWEGVGLCSYLLIGFYFHKKSAGDAGKKAFVVNRIGDAGFILGMLLLFSVVGTLRFVDVNKALGGGAFHAEAGHFGVLSAAALLLFIGATGKSARLPSPARSCSGSGFPSPFRWWPRSTRRTSRASPPARLCSCAPTPSPAGASTARSARSRPWATPWPEPTAFASPCPRIRPCMWA